MDQSSRKRARQRSDTLRDAVEAAVNAADPLGLLEMGAPRDEYESEIETILPRLADAQSAGDVRRVLHEEFVRWFNEGLAGAAAAYDSPAQQIWDALEKWRAE